MSSSLNDLEIERAEEAIKNDLHELLAKGCVNIAAEIHKWLGKEIERRKPRLEAAE